MKFLLKIFCKIERSKLRNIISKLISSVKGALTTRVLMCVMAKNFVKIGHRVLEIAISPLSRSMVTICHLGFSNVSSPVSVGGLMCSVVQKFVKIGRTAVKITNLTFFKMAAVCHVGFLKNDILNSPIRVHKANMHQHAKFHRNWQNHCWDIAIYHFFKMAAVCHFGFNCWANFGTTLKEYWWSISLCKIWL